MPGRMPGCICGGIPAGCMLAAPGVAMWFMYCAGGICMLPGGPPCIDAMLEVTKTDSDAGVNVFDSGLGV